MSESILTSTKKNLGLAEDFTAFDQDVIMHINTAFATLNQVGIGPVDGFAIEDDDPTWDAFFGTNLKYNGIKTYVYLYVRGIFDPPQTSYLGEAMTKQREELLTRLSYVREETEWVDPTPPSTLDEEYYIFEGGEV